MDLWLSLSLYLRKNFPDTALNILSIKDGPRFKPDVAGEFSLHSRSPARCDIIPFELMWPSGISVLGPRLWNSLPRLLRDTSHNTNSLEHSLKTFFSQEYECTQQIRGFGDYALNKSMLSYLLTYLLNIIINNNDIYKVQTLPMQQMHQVSSRCTMTVILEQEHFQSFPEHRQ